MKSLQDFRLMQFGKGRTNISMHRVKSRSNHRRCSVEKGFLTNFANLTGKHRCWSLFLIVTGLPVCNFIKNRF